MPGGGRNQPPGSGFNAYAAGDSVSPWIAPITAITKTGETCGLATTQGQDRVLGRDLIREGDLDQFNSHPEQLTKHKMAESLYEPFQYPGRTRLSLGCGPFW